MSNIGFMKNCTLSVEKLFNECIANPKKNPTEVEKEQYRNLMYQLGLMYKNNEIEDVKKFKMLWNRLKKSDITQIKEIRKQN